MARIFTYVNDVGVILRVSFVMEPVVLLMQRLRADFGDVVQRAGEKGLIGNGAGKEKIRREDGDGKVRLGKHEVDEMLLFVVTCWKKAIPNLGYARHWSVAKTARFELPVVEPLTPNHEYTNDDINWQYMQNYIKKIEQERITELEQEHIAERNAYMEVTGLDDYELTSTDREILSLSAKYRKFRVDRVFDRVLAKCKKEKFDKRKDTSTVPNEEFCIPLVNAKLGDNGIMFYGRKSDWNTQRMCIDIIQNGAVATGTVYVQPQPVAVLWDAYLIRPIEEVKSEKVLLYLAKCIEKVTKEQFSYDKKATWDRAKDCEISLPVTQSGKIDFDYMERYISAIEKLAIADVVKYKNGVIETAKRIVGM